MLDIAKIRRNGLVAALCVLLLLPGLVPGGKADAPRAWDTVINGVSGRVTTDESGVSAIHVTRADNIDPGRRLEVTNKTRSAAEYALTVDAETAASLAGTEGQGLSYTAGEVSITLPGPALTGEDFSVSFSEPDQNRQKAAGALAEELSAAVSCAGREIRLTGAAIGPEDRVHVRMELPAGVDMKTMTALIFLDEEGNSTALPWKLQVAGTIGYVNFYLPESGLAIPMAGSGSFSGVAGEFWGAEAIRDAGEHLMLRGFPDGTFRPNLGVTRAEFLDMLLRCFGLTAATPAETAFQDVKPEDWFCRTLDVAAGLGLLDPGAENAFPNECVTRAEGAAFTARLLRLTALGEPLAADEAETALETFPDADSIPENVREDFALCAKDGILIGIKHGAAAPGQVLSRAQAAMIAARISASLAASL